MTLFPIRKPTIGLSFSPHAITSIHLTRAFWPGQRRRVSTVTCQHLQPALLRPSKEQDNILDTQALTGHLKTLISPTQRTPVALSLPNQSAYMTLLYFDQLPRRLSEQDALIRWKLETEHEIPLNACRIEYRTFTAPLGQQTDRSTGHYVLAAAMRQSILDQYEQVCLDAGLLPTLLGVQGLQLYELYRAAIPNTEETFFASFLDNHFFFLALRGACPTFIRSKPLADTSISKQQALSSTIQFYDETCASMARSIQGMERSLYLLQEDAQHAPGALASTREIESTPPTSTDLFNPESLRITLHSLEQKTLSISWPNSNHPWTTGLSALASLSE